MIYIHKQNYTQWGVNINKITNYINLKHNGEITILELDIIRYGRTHGASDKTQNNWVLYNKQT